MSPSELGEYLALQYIDDWSWNRGDLQAGTIAAVMANVNRDSKRKAEPFKASDFMPYAEAQKSDEQRQAEFRKRVRAALAPRIVKRKKRA